MEKRPSACRSSMQSASVDMWMFSRSDSSRATLCDVSGQGAKVRVSLLFAQLRLLRGPPLVHTLATFVVGCLWCVSSRLVAWSLHVRLRHSLQTCTKGFAIFARSSNSPRSTLLRYSCTSGSNVACQNSWGLVLCWAPRCSCCLLHLLRVPLPFLVGCVAGAFVCDGNSPIAADAPAALHVVRGGTLILDASSRNAGLCRAACSENEQPPPPQGL